MKRLIIFLGLSLSLILSTPALADEPIVGEVRIWPASTPPAGWLICDGATLSNGIYPTLYGVIGTTYGGSGSTFRLPDMRGKGPMGFSAGLSEFDALGESGGERTHTLTVNEMPSHRHDIGYASDATGQSTIGNSFRNGGSHNAWTSNSSQGYYSGSYIIGSTGGGQAHNVLDPYVTLNFIIYTGVGLPTATPTQTPTTTATPTQTATPTDTPTPAGTYTPMPTYTPWPTYTPMPTYTPVITGSTYLPYLSAYTTTLQTGNILVVPEQVSFGQIIMGSVIISLLAVGVLRFIYGVVFRA